MKNGLRGLLGGAPSTQSYSKPERGKRPPTTPDQEVAILRDRFTVGKWHGLDNHLCAACGAGFLGPADAVDHWLAQHSGWSPPPKTDIVDTGLVSAAGNPIFKQVEAPPDPDKEADE